MTKETTTKVIINTILATMLIITVILFINGINHKANGIIILPGYEHAVVLCGETTTINEGHENDPQIKELIALSKIECAKL